MTVERSKGSLNDSQKLLLADALLEVFANRSDKDQHRSSAVKFIETFQTLFSLLPSVALDNRKQREKEQKEKEMEKAEKKVAYGEHLKRFDEAGISKRVMQIYEG